MRKVLRVTPGGNVKGTATNPGFKSRRGRSARLATSTPARMELLRKRRLSLTSGARRGRIAVGGNSDKLINTASIEAATPSGRSSLLQFAIASQILIKKTKRAAEAVVFNDD